MTARSTKLPTDLRASERAALSESLELASALAVFFEPTSPTRRSAKVAVAASLALLSSLTEAVQAFADGSITEGEFVRKVLRLHTLFGGMHFAAMVIAEKTAASVVAKKRGKS